MSPRPSVRGRLSAAAAASVMSPRFLACARVRSVSSGCSSVCATVLAIDPAISRSANVSSPTTIAAGGAPPRTRRTSSAAGRVLRRARRAEGRACDGVYAPAEPASASSAKSFIVPRKQMKIGKTRSFAVPPLHFGPKNRASRAQTERISCRARVLRRAKPWTRPRARPHCPRDGPVRQRPAQRHAVCRGR